MNVSGSGRRKITSWIDGFCEYTEPKPSPLIFRRWSAIATVASVLSRKVWTVPYAGSTLYPNFYILLVGGPAAGKTVPIDVIREDFFRELDGYFLAPKSLTAASLSDSLFEAKHRIVRPAQIPPYVEYNSLFIASPEFGTFISTYDPDMIQRLTDLWDNGAYEERRRGRDIKLNIPKAQLNILAGTTPSYLNSFMPQGAWEQGFIARFMLVFSDERMVKPLFSTDTGIQSLREDLISDLRKIADLYGQMSWEPNAAAAIQEWHAAGGPPAPNHPRLLNYCGRRTAHLLKLSMIASASTSDGLVITLEHFNMALNWLLEVEYFMPDVFKAIASGGDGAHIDDTWHFVWTLYQKENRPIAEHRIIQFLQQRVPAHSIYRIIEMMVRGNIIEPVDNDARGRSLYKPVPKQSQSP